MPTLIRFLAQGEDGGGEMWVLKPGARIPVEGELRKIITPDAWCTHESMKRGILHLKDAGLGTEAVLAQVPQDRLRLMFEALPPSPVRSALAQDVPESACCCALARMQLACR